MMNFCECKIIKKPLKCVDTGNVIFSRALPIYIVNCYACKAPKPAGACECCECSDKELSGPKPKELSINNLCI